MNIEVTPKPQGDGIKYVCVTRINGQKVTSNVNLTYRAVTALGGAMPAIERARAEAAKQFAYLIASKGI